MPRKSGPVEREIRFSYERVVSSDPIGPRDVSVITRLRRELYKNNLISTYGAYQKGYGTLSVRLKEPNHLYFHITGHATGIYAKPDETKYVRVMSWSTEEMRLSYVGDTDPSSESLLHGLFYQIDPSLHGVVHVLNNKMWTYYGTRLQTLSSQVEHGTKEELRELQYLYENTDFRNTKIIVMANYRPGLIILGKSAREAVKRTVSYQSRAEGL